MNKIPFKQLDGKITFSPGKTKTKKDKNKKGQKQKTLRTTELESDETLPYGEAEKHFKFMSCILSRK